MHDISSTPLRFGASTMELTPSYFGPLAGMNEIQTASDTCWPITARAFVFDDDRGATVIVTLDLLNISSETVQRIRAAIREATEVPPESVMLACSHTHSAPFTTFFAGQPADHAFLRDLEVKVVSAVVAAWQRREPAKLAAATSRAEGFTFNRRAVFTGEQVATHGPATAPGYVRHEGPADDELAVLVARDGGGECLGGLVNFASHPTLTGFAGVYSADFPGPLLDALESRCGGTFGFLQGASGNLCPVDDSLRGGRTGGVAAAEEFGQALGQLAARSIEDAPAKDHPPGGLVRGTSSSVQVRQRSISSQDVAAARAYLAGEMQELDLDQVNRKLSGFDFTFHNNRSKTQEWFARDTVGIWEWQQRASVEGLTEALEVQVVTIGDTAVVAVPCELFTELGLVIKKASPFPSTMIASLANGYHGYVPTAEAFDRGGYETRMGQQSRLEPKAGQRLVEAAAELLTEQFASREATPTP